MAIVQEVTLRCVGGVGSDQQLSCHQAIVLMNGFTGHTWPTTVNPFNLYFFGASNGIPNQW